MSDKKIIRHNRIVDRINFGLGITAGILLCVAIAMVVAVMFR